MHLKLYFVNDGFALDAVQQTVTRDTPVWLRIERVGDDLNGYYALDEAGTTGWRWAGILRPSPWFRRSSVALYADHASDPFHEGSHEGSNDWGRNTLGVALGCGRRIEGMRPHNQP